MRYSPVAQLAEQTAVNRRVAGSNPARGANSVVSVFQSSKGLAAQQPYSLKETPVSPTSLLIIVAPWRDNAVFDLCWLDDPAYRVPHYVIRSQCYTLIL